MIDLVLSFIFLMLAHLLVIYTLYRNKKYKLSIIFGFILGIVFTLFSLTCIVAYDNHKKLEFLKKELEERSKKKPQIQMT